jgi:hypothetical protein
VAEMHTCFQQLLQLRLRHYLPFMGLTSTTIVSLSDPSLDGHPDRDQAV